jgi:hypothetical protein
MPWSDVFASILKIEGGVHPALFLLVILALFTAIIVLWRSWKECEELRRKESSEWIAQREEFFEKRFAEQKEILIALERNTTGMATLTSSLNARTEPIKEMVNGLSSLVISQQASRDHFKEQANRLEGNTGRIMQLLTDLQYRREHQQRGR